VGAKGSTGAVALLSILFPSMQYIFYLMINAKFQQIKLPLNLTENPPNSEWQISGIVLWIFAIIQIIVFPILAGLVERALYGTASTDRTMTDSETASGAHVAVKLTDFNKVYRAGRVKRFFMSCFGRKASQEVHAVKDLNLEVVEGQIVALLGTNDTSFCPFPLLTIIRCEWLRQVNHT
jgi:ATP-binding cassette subfamily A (ABC1) protein 3